MDGDLQHDPDEIPRFLAKLEEGYDVVSGWRAQRADNFVLRRIPSRIANWMMAQLSGVRHPRLRHHLQGLSPRGHPEHPALRRDAPLHPRAGQLVRRDHLRGSHLEPRARKRPEPLRPRPHLPRLLRPAHHSLPAQVHDAPAALLRRPRLGRRAFGRRHCGAGCSSTSCSPARMSRASTLRCSSLPACSSSPACNSIGVGLLGELQVRHFLTHSHRSPYAVERVVRMSRPKRASCDSLVSERRPWQGQYDAGYSGKQNRRPRGSGARRNPHARSPVRRGAGPRRGVRRQLHRHLFPRGPLPRAAPVHPGPGGRGRRRAVGPT